MNMNETMKEIRKSILRTSHLGRDGNIQSCFSSAEILWVLYDRVMRISPELAKNNVHDRFVLSKGQSNLALMAVLARKGYLPLSELDTFGQYDSRISMQADRTKLDGIVETSAGSLGHGFPMAVGMAWASAIKGTDERIFVLAGDGEMNEGTMWEAALFASSEKMDHLTLIIDDNDSIGRMLDMGDMEAKLRAFGFSVQQVDGHDVEHLEKVLLSKEKGKPSAVIAHTVRGYGSPTLMEDRSWFHRWPNESELVQLIREVDVF